MRSTRHRFGEKHVIETCYPMRLDKMAASIYYAKNLNYGISEDDFSCFDNGKD